MKKLVIGIAAVAMSAFAIVAARVNAAPAEVAVPAQVCGPALLKGTWSFLTTGYGPGIPQEVFPTPVNFSGTAFPLHAIGHVRFSANGDNVGYTQENIGGSLEGDVPFTGITLDWRKGPHGEGCQATWKLQDQHKTPPFDKEPAHLFRIVLNPKQDMFHFITFGGALGPVTLSGSAYKSE